MTDIRAQYPTIYTAPTLDALELALRHDGQAWFVRLAAQVAPADGPAIYEGIPAWGERTEGVRSLLDAAGPSGDLLSWDTTSPNVEEHRYLRRAPLGDGQLFNIWTHDDVRRYTNILARETASRSPRRS